MLTCVVKLDNIGYRLTYRNASSTAYRSASTNGVKSSFNNDLKMAGIDWIWGWFSEQP
jgi:hypothetical protein